MNATIIKDYAVVIVAGPPMAAMAAHNSKNSEKP